MLRNKILLISITVLSIIIIRHILITFKDIKKVEELKSEFYKTYIKENRQIFDIILMDCNYTIGSNSNDAIKLSVRNIHTRLKHARLYKDDIVFSEIYSLIMSIVLYDNSYVHFTDYIDSDIITAIVNETCKDKQISILEDFFKEYSEITGQTHVIYDLEKTIRIIAFTETAKEKRLKAIEQHDRLESGFRNRMNTFADMLRNKYFKEV